MPHPMMSGAGSANLQSGSMTAFGPWIAGLPEVERTARLRSLRTLVRLLAPREVQLVSALKMAEADPAALDEAYHRLLGHNGAQATADLEYLQRSPSTWWRHRQASPLQAKRSSINSEVVRHAVEGLGKGFRRNLGVPQLRYDDRAS
jgi:hypothetical protein